MSANKKLFFFFFFVQKDLQRNQNTMFFVFLCKKHRKVARKQKRRGRRPYSISSRIKWFPTNILPGHTMSVNSWQNAKQWQIHWKETQRKENLHIETDISLITLHSPYLCFSTSFTLSIRWLLTFTIHKCRHEIITNTSG